MSTALRTPKLRQDPESEEETHRDAGQYEGDGQGGADVGFEGGVDGQGECLSGAREIARKEQSGPELAQGASPRKGGAGHETGQGEGKTDAQNGPDSRLTKGTGHEQEITLYPAKGAGRRLDIERGRDQDLRQDHCGGGERNLQSEGIEGASQETLTELGSG